MRSVLQKIKEFVFVLRSSKYLGLLIVLVLAAVIPLTVIVSQMNQDTRQRAAQTRFASKMPENFNKKIEQPEYVPGDVLIKFKFTTKKIKLKPNKAAQGLSLEKNIISFSDIDEESIPLTLTSLNKKYKIKTIEKVFKENKTSKSDLESSNQVFPQGSQEAKKMGMFQIFKLSLEDNTKVEQAIEDLKESLEIEFAEPNFIYHEQTVSADDPYFLDVYPSNVESRDVNWNPSFDYQWGLKKIDIEQAWNSATLSGEVIVAVVDSGVDYSHPEFGGCTILQVNNNQCPKIVKGYDFVNNDDDPMDDRGHGTHVAGTIASLTNNNTGIAGMNPPGNNIKIMPMKGLDGEGNGNVDNLSAGIVEAIRRGARVINMSYGPKYPYAVESEVEKSAIEEAFTAGAVLVAAAGNSNGDVANGYWPANNPRVIAVSATDYQDKKASFSNYGYKISVAAPGVDILSLKSSAVISSSIGTYYSVKSGTSMAAPHVAGLAALLFSKTPSFSNTQVRALIENNANDIGNSGVDQYFGHGRINVSHALAGISPPIAEIYSPANNGFINGIYQIIGTVGGTTFSSYKLEMGQGSDPTAWITDGITLSNEGKQPVTNGVIGTINTTSLKGEWVLKLTVFDNGGLTSELKVKITIDQDIKQGWPKELDYDASFSQGDLSFFITADISGDSKKEVFATSHSGNAYVWDSSGQLLSGWPKYLGGGIAGRADTIPSSADFNNDGKKEIVVKAHKAWCEGLPYTSTSFCPGSQVVLSTDIHLLNSDGNEVSSNWPQVGAYNSYSNPIIEDIGGIGILSILAFNSSDNKLHIFDYEGDKMKKDLSSGGSKFMSIGDIDGDRKKEVVFAKDNLILAYRLELDGTSTLLWSKDVDFSETNNIVEVTWAKPTLADIDLDGKSEIIVPAGPPGSGGSFSTCKVFVFKYDGSNASGWPYSPFIQEGNCNRSPVAVGDIEKDGLIDLILGTDKGHVFVLNSNGSIKGTLYGNSFYSDFNRGAAISDINGDGFPDILIGTSRYGLSKEAFFAWDNNGNPIAGWPKDILTVSTPLVTDIDNDSKVDILTFGNENHNSRSKIYVWSPSGAVFSSSYLDWPMFGFNEKRTSAWLPPRSIITPTPTPYHSPTPTPTPRPVPPAPIITNPDKGVYFGERDIGGVYGKGNYLLFENSKLNPGNEFSIELWVKPEKIIEKTNETPSYFSDILVYSPKNEFYKRAYELRISKWIGNTYVLTFVIQESYNSGSGSFNNVSFQLPDNWITTSPWMHVGVTIKDKQLKLYVNGQLVAQKTIQGIYIADNPVLTVGGIIRNDSYIDSESQFYGLVDDLRISNTVRDITSNWDNLSYLQPLSVDTNTLAYWRFENNLNDSSQNGINGTSSGNITYVNGIVPAVAPTPTNTPTPTPIRNIGKALYIEDKAGNGTASTYATTTDASGITAITNDMTIEAWIKPELKNNVFYETNTIFGRFANNSDFDVLYNLQLQTFGYAQNISKPAFSIKTSKGYVYLNADYSIIDDGTKWTHLALTKKGNELKMFVNGSLKATALITDPLSDQTNAILAFATRLNKYTKPTTFFGVIDDLRLSNTARDVEDNWRKGIYTRELTIDNNTLALWRFDGDLKDSGINHLDGTAFGDIAYTQGNVEVVVLPSQTFNFQKGWNMVGLAVDKGSDYKAADLLKDLNDLSDQSFKPSEKFTKISRWIYGGYEGYRLGYTFNDFPVVVGKGYLIKAERPLTVTLTGSTVALPKTIQLGYSWNLISFPSVPAQINTAEKLLQAIKNQAIGAVEISRVVDGGSWDSSSNFVINPGEGYFIRVNTNPGVFNLPEETTSTASSITVSLKALSNLSTPPVPAPTSIPTNTPTPTPTKALQLKVSFRTSTGTPVSQKFCSACFNANGGYVKSYACYTGSDVIIPKPAVCSGDTYNPTVGIDTKRSDIVNGTISQVTANPTLGFKSLYNNAYLGWTDGTGWTTGERTLNIIVNPKPSPTPYRRVTPTPVLSAPKITSINVMSVNKVVTITGSNFLNAVNVNSEQYVSVRDGKGGVLNMGSPKSGGRWLANQIQFQLPQNFSLKTGYMIVYSNDRWSNQFPFSY